MRVKDLVARKLRRFPLLMRGASWLYHLANRSFRSLSAGGPEAVLRGLQEAKNGMGSEPGDYYEFGVFRGFTLLSAFESANELELDKMRFWGFDSFEGLPELEESDRGDGEFFEGQFSCSRDKVEKALGRRGFDWGRAALVEGFFDSRLTEELRSEHPFAPAAVVNLDCDLHSSTRDALNWIRPYLQNGTVLLFDDYYSYGRREDRGQPLALAEFLNENGKVTVKALWEYPFHGKAFRVVME